MFIKSLSKILVLIDDRGVLINGIRQGWYIIGTPVIFASKSNRRKLSLFNGKIVAIEEYIGDTRFRLEWDKNGKRPVFFSWCDKSTRRDIHLQYDKSGKLFRVCYNSI